MILALLASATLAGAPPMADPAAKRADAPSNRR
jgi:hypothetical protein